MGKKRYANDGLGFPKPGTQVRYIRSGRGVVHHLDGKTVYVCSTPANENDGIVVDEEPGQEHGFFCTEWEELSPVESLDDDTKKALAEAALEIAKKRGYCDETKTILKDLGFPTNFPKKRTITVEIEVEEEEGFSFNISRLTYNSDSGKVKVLNKTVVS